MAKASEKLTIRIIFQRLNDVNETELIAPSWYRQSMLCVGPMYMDSQAVLGVANVHVDAAVL